MFAVVKVLNIRRSVLFLVRRPLSAWWYVFLALYHRLRGRRVSLDHDVSFPPPECAYGKKFERLVISLLASQLRARGSRAMSSVEALAS